MECIAARFATIRMCISIMAETKSCSEILTYAQTHSQDKLPQPLGVLPRHQTGSGDRQRSPGRFLEPTGRRTTSELGVPSFFDSDEFPSMRQLGIS